VINGMIHLHITQLASAYDSDQSYAVGAKICHAPRYIISIWKCQFFALHGAKSHISLSTS